MSVFGLLRKGRQAAKEHKAELAQKQKQEEAKPAYKHIPTHAAVDALSGAPSGWRHEDRPRIMEQNRRRSAMAASGMGSSTMMATGIGMTPVHAGMPRMNSALSHVSYPSVYANPVVALPRTYSYNGSIHPPWNGIGSEVLYSQADQQQPPQPQPQPPVLGKGKGKGVERTIMVDSGRASRASSKAPSPVGSSGDSTSSQDDLEMKGVRHAQTTSKSNSSPSSSVRGASKSSPRAAESEHVHRLHPSQSRPRRPSDPPPAAMDRYYPPRSASSSFTGRPPLSHSAHSSQSTPSIHSAHSIHSIQSNGPKTEPPNLSSTMGIPPVPSLPPMSFGPTLSSSAASSSSSNTPSIASSTTVSPVITSNISTVPSTPPARPSRPESPVSPVSPVSDRSHPSVNPPVAVPQAQFDFPFRPTAHISLPPTTTTRASAAAPQLPPVGNAAPIPGQSYRRPSKGSRFSELEPISSNVETHAVSRPGTFQRSNTWASVDGRGLPTEFDFSASQGPTTTKVDPARSGKSKLTKAPQAAKAPEVAKAAKKSRWSLRSKPTPVAG